MYTVYTVNGPDRGVGGGQAERRTPATRGRSLDLIHTNNSPNPVSMRVPGRLGGGAVQCGCCGAWVLPAGWPDLGGAYARSTR